MKKLALALLVLVACHHGGQPPPDHHGAMQKGVASWYDEPQKTASGERFDPNAMTAAHRSLPLGTLVRVTNTRNGRSVVVRINDRGPYGHGRIIDLSRAAARQLHMIDAGTAPVTVEVVGHR